jgi:hypothetical protein
MISFIQGYRFLIHIKMDKQKIHYCFTLSEEQVEYLRSKKYKIDRMECFMSLATLAVRDKTVVTLSKTMQVEILPGQVMVDNTQLAHLWDKDRKTVPKLLEAMEKMGISSSQKVGDNRIHTLHSLSGWYVDGHFRPNDFAMKRQSGDNAIFHKEVPPAKVIIIEADDLPTKDKEDKAQTDDKSHGADEVKTSTANEGVAPDMALSNDSAAVGNVADAVPSSLTSSDELSPLQGEGTHFGDPQFSGENVGTQNEGREDEAVSSQDESPQPQGKFGSEASQGFQYRP